MSPRAPRHGGGRRGLVWSVAFAIGVALDASGATGLAAAGPDAVPVFALGAGPGEAADANHSASAAGLGLNSAAPELPAGLIDTVLRRAAEDPDAALAALAELGGAQPPHQVEGLERLRARARVQAVLEARDSLRARVLLAEAETAARLHPEDLALLQAQLAEQEGDQDLAATRARETMDLVAAACPANLISYGADANADADGDDVELEATSAPDLRAYPACDYRALWQVQRILERQALAGGVVLQARALARTRLRIARAGGDAYRQALTWSVLGYFDALSERPKTRVEAHLAAARRNAAVVPDPGLRIALLTNEAAVARLRGDLREALQRVRSALALARDRGLKRVQPALLNNLADSHLHLRQPRQALRAIAEALPLAGQTGEQRVLHSLHSNAGLAHIALGHIEVGKQEMQRAEALLGSEGNEGRRVEMLREYGEALAAAGDARGALELYHRERALSAGISKANLEAALREIQASFDAEVRERDMALLRDQVALRNEELASQDLTLRIWLLLLGLLVVLLLLGAVVYRRLRGRERQLSEGRERLRRESEQDPLTGLGNRRAFEARMQRLRHAAPLPGALLLIDVDHFKRINDGHGHAAGDIVLVEVARRIAGCLRQDDLVVRWGGEEFLLHVAGTGSAQALLLARRILERIVAEPVLVASGELRVTASLGLCMDHLPGIASDLPWEERLRLADLALYAAKSRGRNRAVAVVDSTASAEALRAPEIDFEAAERSGLLRVQTAVIGR